MDYRRPGILQAKDVVGFDRPVFLIVASQDIFFPADRSIQKAKQVFATLKEVHVMKGAKHMPAQSDFPVIQSLLRAWLE